MKRIIKTVTSFILMLTLICSMIAPVFAKETKKLTDRDLVEQSLYVVTLNIKGGRHQVDDPNKKITIDYNLSHIANAIIKLAPDIVGFQEVDKNTTRAENKDQIKLLCPGKLQCFFAASGNLGKKSVAGNHLIEHCLYGCIIVHDQNGVCHSNSPFTET